MNIETITTPVWGDKEHTIINCMVKFAELESPVPFTATEDDCEAHGREIFAACQRGDAGEIGKYVSSVTPEKARSAKTAEINAWRDAMEAASYVFEFNGRRWDYGKETQARLEPSAAAARAGTLPEQFFWTDADNNDVPMTAEELIALSDAAQQAMFTKGMEIHVRQRNMKKEIAELQDVEAILGYAVGWPATDDSLK
ncbi:TPA: DUF4376 domain-containing protein [Escherichia coli]|nr:DUF4376 domain-containing protein [Escherichia coli]